ncbi:hypothetical protein KKJ11_22280, partial [Xenorhabdus bovienii]|uniref:hypothetical protein n=1 Tax=Xenorhabdus bovienii TaxID=40576 RepID=UPI0023B30987
PRHGAHAAGAGPVDRHGLHPHGQLAHGIRGELPAGIARVEDAGGTVRRAAGLTSATAGRTRCGAIAALSGPHSTAPRRWSTPPPRP